MVLTWVQRTEERKRKYKEEVQQWDNIGGKILQKMNRATSGTRVGSWSHGDGDPFFW